MNENIPQAAVALIVTECASPSVLLLRRAKNSQDPWSGQWAFPGGKWEDGDKDLIDTSIRETYEECGCLLSRDELIMPLPLATAGNYSGFPVIVAPFLWKIKEKKELQLDTTEMEEARWQEIHLLKDDSLHEQDLIIPDYPDKSFSYIMLNDVPLWGFTYGVLMSYLKEHDVS
jgi:8-oxo-dGTP pyrophosphatase MutT (NUDIX family)